MYCSTRCVAVPRAAPDRGLSFAAKSGTRGLGAVLELRRRDLARQGLGLRVGVAEGELSLQLRAEALVRRGLG